MQKQEQTPQDPRLAVIGGTHVNIGQKPGQVEVKGGGENPEEASKNSGSDWLISIKEELKKARKDELERAREDDAAISCSKPCIYTVPRFLRNAHDKAFDPLNVSLGPYHHGKEHLSQMEHHKWRFLNRVLVRTHQDIEVYLDSVREVEKRARSCYEGPIHHDSDKFVTMMVLDGCFVLELFRGADEGFEKLGYPRNDPIFARFNLIDSIKRDMIMLENQLPLFILDRLLKLQYSGCRCHKDVAELAVTFFEALIPTDPNYPIENQTFDRSDAGLHCLEILWGSRLGGSKADPSCTRRLWPKIRHEVIHCATELRDSGIKFKRSEEVQFWDIKFENGVLLIPQLLIDDSTKSLFLNLIAFEQCHFDCSNHITSYVLFMDNLINSCADVAHLHSCAIIEHWLGSDTEVAELFNRLCQGVVLDLDDNYLSKLSGEVNEYKSHRRNTWKATFRHKYLNSPWAIISVGAAVILLLLTFMQTFYGVYAYYRPSS